MAVLEYVECSDIEGKSTHEIFLHYRAKADQYGRNCDWFYLKQIAAVTRVIRVPTYNEAVERAESLLEEMCDKAPDCTAVAVTCPQGPLYEGKHGDYTTVFFVGVFME